MADSFWTEGAPAVAGGTDLHWLWGWGAKVAGRLEDNLPPSRDDWMIFRPDSLARDSIIHLAAQHPLIIAEIREYLDWAEKTFTAFLADEEIDTQIAFVGALRCLCERIRTAVETMAKAGTAAKQRADGGETPLFDQVLAVLTPNQSRIMEKLWVWKTASYEKLRTIPQAWQDVPSDDAVEKALKRIAGKLNEFPQFGVTISIQSSKGRVNLDRPADE